MTESVHDECRRAQVSQLRADLAVKAQQCRQLESALDVLLDQRYESKMAVEIAHKILNANIGP